MRTVHLERSGSAEIQKIGGFALQENQAAIEKRQKSPHLTRTADIIQSAVKENR